MVRIAVIDDYQNVARDLADWGSLPDGSVVDFYTDHLTDHDALVERLKDYEVIQLMRERTSFPAELLDALPNLRMLSGTGRGYGNTIDIPHCTERGIVLTGTGGSAGGSVEELTWALILGLTKRLREEDQATREGRWQTNLTPLLSGRRLGVIGLGRLGSRVARLGLAFNMELIAWSPWLTDERAAEHGATRVSREELFSTAYVITIHLPLTPESTGLVGAADLAMMRPDAFLINTSRGPIVDEAALVDALREGVSAARDWTSCHPFLDEEPLPDRPPLPRPPQRAPDAAHWLRDGEPEEGYGSFYAGLTHWPTSRRFSPENPLKNMINPGSGRGVGAAGVASLPAV